MATTRHQVDNLGNIVIGEKAKIQNIEGFFEYLFTQFNWKYEIIEKNKSLYKIKFTNINKTYIVNLFYGDIRDESRNDDEVKIQSNSMDPRPFTKNLDEKTIIIGGYTYMSSDPYKEALLVAWPVIEDVNYDKNVSIRTNISLIQKAKINGFASGENYKNHLICAFRPEFFFYYLENSHQIHQKNINKNLKSSTTNSVAENIIYFGSPGTGKSFAADEKTGANIEGRKEFVEKTTFHPEYDYNSFVGGYKPVMVKKGEENKIEYKFLPQIFTNIYVKAWNDLDKHYFLQIEEINRGNCAEIFGDLFQLLDRDENGKSKYEITATEDLRIYLEENLKENGLDGIKGGKLRLSSNLSIVATMNTSDQSLFPMDSAFKRRWDWEYVPIEYDPTKTKSDFIIILNSGSKYKWLEFLKEVNKKILDATRSQDKQVGNWFINAKNTNYIINEKTFINKVIFYLWNDVFKDEDSTIFKDENNEIIKDSKDITYEHFFTNNINSKLVEHIFANNLNLKKIEDEVSSEPEEA
ncbi:McrB family protein [Aliarcobacter cryaerophilus]|uniref:McrB family protein n=1 Tax=Aliarcobacter cryaerophilus TaxID=28198 RepID=UPI0011DF85F7|nr:AAA family ATPase [Aliarcobacter cryaerophilus]